jgi:hypothetical protein
MIRLEQALLRARGDGSNLPGHIADTGRIQDALDKCRRKFNLRHRKF